MCSTEPSEPTVEKKAGIISCTLRITTGEAKNFPTRPMGPGPNMPLDPGTEFQLWVSESSAQDERFVETARRVLDKLERGLRAHYPDAELKLRTD